MRASDGSGYAAEMRATARRSPWNGAGATEELTPAAGDQGVPVDPEVPGPVAAVAGALFGGLSKLRGARVFHPHGVGYTGTLTIDRLARAYPGVPLLERSGEYPVLMRFSRAAGLPEPLPDALGLALRVVDAHGNGRHQDFVLVTSANGPLVHHLLLPSPRGFFSQPFSSLLLYRIGRNLRLVGAQPVRRPLAAARGTLREIDEAAHSRGPQFHLTLASLAGGWKPVGALHLGERLADEDTERLAFTPWNTGGGIRPVGPLMGLRRAAYRASQKARGLTDTEIP